MSLISSFNVTSEPFANPPTPELIVISDDDSSEDENRSPSSEEKDVENHEREIVDNNDLI